MGAIVTARKFEGGYINLPSLLAGASVWSYSFTLQYVSGQVILQSGIEANVASGNITVGAFQTNTRSGITTVIPDANAHNYTLTCDGTNRKLYLDGTLKGSDTNGGAIQNRTNGKIGMNEDSNVTGFTSGFLTELLLFTKCLSAAEVAVLVGNTSPDTTGMTGRYKFNEASGITTASPIVGSASGSYVGTWNAPQSITLPNTISVTATRRRAVL